VNVVVAIVLGVVALGLGLAVGLTRGRAKALDATSTLQSELIEAQGRATVAEQLLAESREALAAKRAEHDALVGSMRDAFEATSASVLEQTVERFRDRDAQLAQTREQTLKAQLDPIRELLKTYEDNLKIFDQDHRDALHAVNQSAATLLESQVKAQSELQRFNQLLGRSDQRGRWGEVQLANVLAASGLREGIDFELQFSTSTESGRQRPDCIIHVHQSHIVVDAKFPFDAFEASIAATDPVEAQLMRQKHADDLKKHVRQLSSKSYWDKMDFTPNFTVCFVPSDSALSAAFDADPTLYAFAVDSQVLLAGPTNLLALLWSASLVLREQRRLENVDKILEVAQRFPDLIRNLVTPLHAMGKSLEQTVKAYNALVGSAESRLIPASRNLQRLGVSPGSKPMPELATLTTDPSLPTAEKWGSDPTDAEVAERSTILELDEFVDEEDVDNGDDLFSE